MYTRPWLAVICSAALAACSDPAEDSRRSAPSSAEAELALTKTAPQEPVASPIEVARPGELKELTSPRQRLATRRRPTTPAIDVATPLPSVAAHVHHTTADASSDLPIIESAGSGPSADRATSDGGTTSDPGSVIGRWPDEGRPGITIRGGHDPLDPCIVHQPRGRAGVRTPEERVTEGIRGATDSRPHPPVAVNPQVPTTRLPSAPRTSGGVLPF